jgi:hypothetical protein
MTRLRIATLVLLLVSGCIPSTRATIEIGTDYDMTSMRRAEDIVEAGGFARSYYESKSGEKQERYSHEGKLISSFEGPVRGTSAAVVLRDADGRLFVEFSERNTSFSESGRQLLDKLAVSLRSEFGKQVVVTE